MEDLVSGGLLFAFGRVQCLGGLGDYEELLDTCFALKCPQP